MVVLFCVLPRQIRSEPLQGKPFTISIKNASLADVLRQVTKKSGVIIYFQDADLSSYSNVSIDVKNKTVDAVLHELLDGRGLTWVVVEKNSIAIRKKAVTMYQNIYSDSAITLSGKVVDEKGQPIIGATVVARGTNKGAATDPNGNFSISDLKTSGTVVISGVGFITQEISYKNSTFIGLVKLKEYVSELDETVIIAYGTTTKRLNTGNVSSVKAKDIERQPINNPLLALQGRVPGLFITQSNGLPGSGVTVRIQGENSIRMGSDPLYVIDGVPFASQLLPGLGNILGSSGGSNATGYGGYGNPLSYLNPNDIESMEVLKDADATAIYGSRAANGAILITTKKGQAGRTKLDAIVRHGYGHVTNMLDLLNTPQYLAMRHEAKSNDNVPILPTDYDINGLWDTTRYTNWQKELIGGTSQYTDANASISGGSSNTQFLLGAGYHHETTVMPGNLSDHKGSVNVNINSASVNQKFRISFSGNFLIDNNDLANIDLTSLARTLAPNAPPLYKADGSLNWATNASGTSSWTNPLSFLYNKYKNSSSNLVSNAKMSYQLFPFLKMEASFGYTSIEVEEITTVPILSYRPERRFISSRRAEYSNSYQKSWIIEPQMQYKRSIGKGNLDILIGATLQQNRDKQRALQGRDYNSDLVLEDVLSAGTIVANRSVDATYKYNALFGRLNYNWENKYIINLTARRDGSSRFGNNSQLHNFGSIGGAWVFSNEPVVQRFIPFLTYGKIRGSYGTTGSDQIGNFQFLSLYSNPVSGNYQGVTGLAPNQIPNPYLKWEETRKLQFGIDFGFLRDRLLFSVGYYRNRSSNQLLPYTLPITAGFGSINTNFPALIQNSGSEISLNTINVKTNKFTWSSNINLTIPSNKLLDFPGLATSAYSNALVVGKPFTLVQLYNFRGVDQSTGVYQFSDIHGNLTTAPNTEDRTIIYNNSPTLYGGFQNNFSYRGFELDLLFQFVKQRGTNYSLGGVLPGRYNTNQPVTVLDRWRSPNDISTIQKFNTNLSLLSSYSYALGSSGAYSDASYVRLKNLSISWHIPEKWCVRSRIQMARIFLQAQNLLTITKYIGYDPETMNTASLPPLRMITMGFQITL
jgi:TonB-linked SusC/RagA family outer membrane protein